MLTLGTEVRVIDGPLAGVEGVVQQKTAAPFDGVEIAYMNSEGQIERVWVYKGSIKPIRRETDEKAEQCS